MLNYRWHFPVTRLPSSRANLFATPLADSDKPARRKLLRNRPLGTILLEAVI